MILKTYRGQREGRCGCNHTGLLFVNFQSVDGETC